MIGYKKDEIKEWMDWFYHQTTPEERLDQLGLRGFNPKNTNVYRGLFPPEKDKLSCKEALDMGEDFASYSKPSNKERASCNPMMCDTPRLNFDDDPERQAQADKFHEVNTSFLRMISFVEIFSEGGGVLFCIAFILFS